MKRDSGTITAGVVIALSAAYAIVLPAITRLMGTAIMGSEYGDNSSVRLVLGVLSFSFLTLAVVVATVVVTNAYVLVTATRTREIALRRLLGSSVRNERQRIARDGLLTGIVGAAIGVIGGVAISAIVVALNNGPDGALAGVHLREAFNPYTLVPVVALIVCARAAAWRGSQGVLDAHPIGALGAATMREVGADEVGSMSVLSWFALSTGTGLLLLSLVLGLQTPYALLIGLLGGMVGTYGFITGATVILPWSFRIIDRLLPRRGYALHASRNMLRYPVRTARASLGVTMSVALLTMFVVATSSFERAMYREYEGVALGMELTRDVLVVAAALISITAAISVLGLATTVNLGTRLRAREIALTRVLGMSSHAASRVVLHESARLAVSATAVGFIIGGILGWIGVQAMLASTLDNPLVMPSMPLIYPPLLLLLTAAITIIAAVVPSRRTLRDSPMAAYANANA